MASQLVAHDEARFYRAHLWHLPSAYLSLCPNRMTLLYFIIGALDLLDDTPSDSEADRICQWILHQQVDHIRKDRCGGFRSGSWLGRPWDSTLDNNANNDYDEGHIAMTYTALATLYILGRTDFPNVDRSAIINSLRYLQRPNGSFGPSLDSEETDTRFVYCACAISTFLNDWSGVDRDEATRFVLNCISYDGAFGLQPGLEGHGGSTYVSVASLHLMGTIDRLSPSQRSRLLRWCIFQQGQGFSGRVNKQPDSCYSFWVGATIEILNGTNMTAAELNRNFLFLCKSRYGGFGKTPGADPDLLHSFFATAGLCIMDNKTQCPLDVSLGVRLRCLHANKSDLKK